MRAHRNGGTRQMGVGAPGDTTGQKERKKMDMPRTVGALSTMKAKPGRAWALTAPPTDISPSPTSRARISACGLPASGRGCE